MIAYAKASTSAGVEMSRAFAAGNHSANKANMDRAPGSGSRPNTRGNTHIHSAAHTNTITVDEKRYLASPRQQARCTLAYPGTRPALTPRRSSRSRPITSCTPRMEPRTLAPRSSLSLIRMPAPREDQSHRERVGVPGVMASTGMRHPAPHSGHTVQPSASAVISMSEKSHDGHRRSSSRR